MDITSLREKFVSRCVRENMFYTLALLQQAKLSYCDKTPTASVSVSAYGITIKMGSLVCSNPSVFYFVLHHEIRHLLQFSGLGGVEEALGKKYSHHWANMCMDAALHEDLMKILPADAAETTKVMSGVVTVDSLQKTIEDFEKKHKIDKKTVLMRNMDWVYYYNQFKDLAGKNPSQGEGNGSGDGFPSEGEGQQGFDEHSIEQGPESTGALKDVIDRAHGEAKRMETSIGSKAADSDLAFDPRAKLNERIRSALNSLNIISKRISAQNVKKQYTFQKTHAAFDYLPGKLRVPGKCRQAVMMLDVSGSMCDDATLSQLYAAAKVLQKDGKLLASYTFDTEMRPFSMEKRKFTGGGGTIIDEKMINEIYKNHGKVDIIVVSDLAISWEVDRTAHRFHLIEV